MAAIQMLLEREMTHRAERGGAMPVLYAGRDANDVSRPDFLNGLATLLNEAQSCLPALV